MHETSSAELLTGRLARLQHLLGERGISLAILTCNTDLYYYTGSVQPLYLLVRPEGEPVLLARKAITRIAEEVEHLPLHPFTGTQELVAILDAAGMRDVTRIAFTLDVTPYATVQRLCRLFPQAELVDLSWDLRTLRMVKSPSEIDTLARAGAIMTRVPELAREHFTPGTTELELSAALEYAFRRQGHDALIRMRREGVEMSACGVCTSGVHSLAGTKFEGICGGVGLSPAVPYGATTEPIERGTPIVLDFAFVLEGYHLDQTRMACWGEPSGEITQAYAAMLHIEQAIFDMMRPGVRWEDVYRLAASMADELGYGDVFMGEGREQVRFVGHGVGIELDEPPFLAPKMPYPLEAGMTIAIEPKVALPGIGVVGIEDTVVIREDGIERLTTCPQDLIILS